MSSVKKKNFYFWNHVEHLRYSLNTEEFSNEYFFYAIDN